ncbi:single-stranded DNA-binding protein [Tepiditoga spiralis]|uniref:Single-stranded DNA-binding protein n=1 Tax=Tepiditoga spiralis TaxID=2108365 RepID=A0A7G1G4T7_9BACT|nr:single-stranded DNA-binding protein [Tepiditoga spiralis]
MIKIQSKQITSKNLETALKEAKEIFKVKEEEISYTLIQKEVKGFLRIGSKPAIIEAYLNETYLLNQISEFLKEITKSFDEGITSSIKIYGKTIIIFLNGEGLGNLIGKHGRTLGALQHLIMIYVNRMTSTKVDIKLDIGDYRKKRRKKIEEITENSIKKLLSGEEEIELAPMFSFERKMVHEYVKRHYPNLITKSVGFEPYRKVVICREEYTPKGA